MKSDEYYMNLALLEAKKAYNMGEVPVGAVIVKNGNVIATGCNCKEKYNNVLKHAEINAIDVACGKVNSWRLNDCVLYTTMEPCIMCIGAIIECRIKRVICGMPAKSEHMFLLRGVDVSTGVLESECLNLMQEFFKNLRNKV